MTISILGSTHQGKKHYKISGVEEDTLLEILPNISLNNVQEFVSTYSINQESEECFCLDLSAEENKDILDSYIKNVDTSGSVNVINSRENGKLVCIYAKVDDKYIHFQRIYPKSQLEKSFFSLEEREYKLSKNNKILLLEHRTDAIIDVENYKLYFFDFERIKPIFKGVDNFYREATDDDLDIFFEGDTLSLESEMDKKDIGPFRRKRIASMMDKNQINTIDIDKSNNYASKYGHSLPLNNDGKIVISKNSDIDLIYKVVNEMFVTTDMTGTKRETNSYKDFN